MKVLAAVDIDDQAELVLRIAARRAKEAAGELGVCHVVPDQHPIHPLFPQAELPTVGVVPELVIRAREALGRMIADKMPDAADVTYFCEQGEPYAEIVRRAEAWGADLVVVAAKSGRGLLTSLLGGVAERVVRYAHCPVIVARNLRDHGHVLAATDLSDPSLPAVEAGLAESRLRGGGFTVLHVLPLMPAVGGGPHGASTGMVSARTLIEMDEATRSTYDERLTRELEQRLHVDDSGASIRVAVGPPAATIVSVASALEAELVVVGTRGRTGVSRVLLGSVAEEVVRTAGSSVMVVRLR